jgi:hypothetical protein
VIVRPTSSRSSSSRTGSLACDCYTKSVVIISNNASFKRAWLSIAVVLAVMAGCSDRPSTPSAPTAPIGAVGVATGLLRGEAPVGRIARPHPVLPNATVTVIGGPAAGTKAVTRDDGTYEVAATGTFKLRFEHPFFVTTESSETVMTENGVTLADVTLLTAPWSISGRITDSLGNPVADVEVITSSADFVSPYGSARTDADGRYTVNSTRPHFASVYVGALKPGFVPMRELLVPCCGTAPPITLVRIVSITPTAPTSLRVGELVEMPASVVVFDSGETRNIFVLPTSSATSVVYVRRSTHWYEMQGLSAGVATLTFDLWGAVATTQVQVR